MKTHLDAEEQEILEKLEQGELLPAQEAEREMSAARMAAQKTFNRTKRVNLRLSERDFNHAQSRAREEGLPYQTLLSSVIHKYLSGMLVERE